MTGKPSRAVDAEAAAALRHRLAEKLALAGDLRSPRWRAAMETVARHEFVAEFFTVADPQDGSPSLYGRADWLGPDEWLALVYSDESLVTQLDGHVVPPDIDGPVPGVPTSSSAMPGLVARMWEALDVQDSDQILEIGTGTGYSTALGCHRLGAQNITSVEVDPTVAARAATALDRIAYHPRLVVGDGLAGFAERAPYDRVIATCALRHIPRAWVEQCRPGAAILVTLSGWLDTFGLAKLIVTGEGTAEGAFIDPDVGFMPARAEAPEFLVIPKLDEDLINERPTHIGPEVFDDPGAVKRVIQLAVPRAQYARFGPGQDLPEHLLVESDDSYVAFHRSSSGWVVRQGGSRAVWDEVEAAIDVWRRAGSPSMDRFRIVVTPDRQTMAFSPDHRWDLPSAASE